MHQSDNIALDALGALLRDPEISRRIWVLNNQNLTVSDVAALLRCSDNHVRKLIKEDKWRMVPGPSGALEMTPDQFREQRQVLMSMDKKRR